MKIKLMLPLLFKIGLLKIMIRTFIFLCCFATFAFSPNKGFTQNDKIKIEQDKVFALTEVFDLIIAQTDYNLIYANDLPEINKTVALKKGIIKADKLLNKCLKNTSFTYDFTTDNTIILVKKEPKQNNTTSGVNEFQQSVTVTGTVTDVNGIPLPGVLITYGENDENGFYKVGVDTDFDGKYSITFTPQGIDTQGILARYYGYKNQFQEVKGRSVIDFVLEEDISKLDEVVITGYQKVNKERATGAFNSIKKEDIRNNATQTVGSLLQGFAPGIGLQEDADGGIDLDDVVVRGIGSIDEDSRTTPLLVVDGFPIAGGFDTLNPNDIESIDILKDAAAASIWGSRAGNGVIVITTKRAKEGKLKVEFNSFVRMRSKIDLDKNLPIANSQTTLAYENRLWQPGGLATITPSITGTPIPNNLSELSSINDSDTFPNYSLGSRLYSDLFNGIISQAEFNSIFNRLSSTNSFDDIDRYLLTTNIQTQYNLSLSTRSENNSTRFSMVYNDNQGSFINTSDEQILVNLNNQYKIKKGLVLDVIGMLDISQSQDSGLNFDNILGIAPYERLINEDGSYASLRGFAPPPEDINDPERLFYDNTFLQMFQSNVTNLPYSDITFNPLRDARGTENVSKSVNFRINAALTIDILDGLQFKPSIQYQRFDTKNSEFSGAETSKVITSVLNGTSRDSFDPIAGTVGQFNVPVGAQLTGSDINFTSYTIRNLLTYNKRFADKHTVSALLGYERISMTTKTTNNAITYGFDRSTNTFSIPPAPDSGESTWRSLLNNASTRLEDGRVFLQDDDHFVSYFGNVSYTYNDRYTVSGSARSDGSNFITEDRSQRFNPMWSVGLSWNAMNESFLEDTDWIDRLKFRATYGRNGNQVPGIATEPTILIAPQPNEFTNLQTASVIDLGNPNLRWEKVTTLNLGLDFGVFQNTFYGSIDYYNRTSDELIANVSVPSTTGFNTARFNVGEIVNKGIELNLNTDFKFNELKWNTNLVFSYNDSETTSLFIDFFSANETANAQYIQGRPVNPIFAYDFDTDQQLIISQSGSTFELNERILEDGRDVLRFMGTSVAPTIAGWNNTITYKGFTLTARLVGKFGHKFRRPTLDYTDILGGVHHEDLENILAGNAESLGLPELITQDTNTNFLYSQYVPNLSSLVEDADHIRLRQIYLSYDFPSNLMHKVGFSRLRVYGQAENLGNIWVANDFGLDPEFVAGISRAPMAAFTLGLNVEF